MRDVRVDSPISRFSTWSDAPVFDPMTAQIYTLNGTDKAFRYSTSASFDAKRVTFQSVQMIASPPLPQRRSQQSLSIAGYPERHNDEMDSAGPTAAGSLTKALA